VIVYAGAIMVLFLFVLMLLNVKREEDVPGRGGRTLASIAVVLVALLAGQAGFVLWNTTLAPAAAFDASTRRMSEILFSPHFLYVFEATSILILAALVAPWRSRRRTPDGGAAFVHHAAAAEPRAVRDRRARRLPAPQRDHRADVHRADAERRQPGLRRLLARGGTLDGQVLVFFVMVVAAAEAASASRS
jgi:hypothetical protein